VSPDLAAAETFMATHARLLDRGRFQVLLRSAEPVSLLAQLEAYRNPDGGFGWGLEPDLRDAPSQPVAAMHALQVFAEAAPATSQQSLELCDWLRDCTLADGGLPFALPITDPTGCAPHWAEADPTASSLQMTSQVAGNAQLLGRHQPSVAAHPWLATATRYCLDAIRGLDQQPHAYELMFALRFLDAVADALPEAEALLSDLGQFLPADGSVPVAGGAVGESLRLLDFAPYPGRPVRRLFTAEAVAADLDRLAALQQADGGWPVDFDSASPAAALEWRGHMTVQAVSILLAN
jgi:hypothetical protein